MYILVALTCLFALRASEAAMLRREDIYLQANPPFIRIPKEKGRGKSPGDVPIMPEQASLLRMWLGEGVTVSRTVKVNQNGARTRHEKYVLPKAGRLFPCRQSTYKKKKIQRPHLGYHAVWSAVRKAAEAFCSTHPGAAKCWKQLRTHSGRSTKITMLMGEGVSLSMSMKFARHSQSSIKTHLAYGKLTVRDIHKYLLQERGRVADYLSTQRRLAGHETPRASSGLEKNQHKDPSDPDKASVRRRCRTKTSDSAPLPALRASTMHPLQDCSLKDAVLWHKDGILDKEEFAAVKRDMIGRLEGCQAA